MKKILILTLCFLVMFMPLTALASTTDTCTNLEENCDLISYSRPNHIKFYITNIKEFFTNNKNDNENSSSNNLLGGNTNANNSTNENTNSNNNDYALNDFEKEVIRLTNEERVKNGLEKLKINYELCKVARMKSMDMNENSYFSHTSPTYGSPFAMMRANGINYKSAGENIAKGQSSAKAVVSSWMNSQGHRKNILNASFTEIGVGFFSGNYWTQMFISK